jgi:hypothetical protein
MTLLPLNKCYSSGLKMKKVCFSKLFTSTYESTWHHNLEQQCHLRCHDNLKSYKLLPPVDTASHWLVGGFSWIPHGLSGGFVHIQTRFLVKVHHLSDIAIAAENGVLQHEYI